MPACAHGDLYSAASTAAEDHAVKAWPEMKEPFVPVLPIKNSPCALSVSEALSIRAQLDDLAYEISVRYRFHPQQAALARVLAVSQMSNNKHPRGRRNKARAQRIGSGDRCLVRVASSGPACGRTADDVQHRVSVRVANAAADAPASGSSHFKSPPSDM